MKTRRLRSLPAALLLLAGAPLGSADVSPNPIPLAESAPGWEGPQFVQADRAGRVYFLRANTLEVKAWNDRRLARTSPLLAEGRTALRDRGASAATPEPKS